MAVVTIPAFDAVYGVAEASICNRALTRIGAEVIKDTEEDTKQSRLCKAIYAQTRDELLRLYPFNFATKTRYIPQDANYPLSLEQYTYAYKAWDYQDMIIDTTAGSPVCVVTTPVMQESDVGLAVIGQGIPENARIIAVDTTTNTFMLDRNCTATALGVAAKKFIPLLKVVLVGGNNNNLYELFGSGEQGRIFTNLVSNVSSTGTNLLEMRCVEQIINPNLFDSIFVDALVLRLAIKIAISFTQSAGLVNLLFQEFAQILQVAKIASAEEKEIDYPEDWYTSTPQSSGRR